MREFLKLTQKNDTYGILLGSKNLTEPTSIFVCVDRKFYWAIPSVIDRTWVERAISATVFRHCEPGKRKEVVRQKVEG